MQVVYSDAHRRHAPKHFLVRGTRVDNPEVPERAENLVAAARAGGHTIVAPDDFGPGPREAVHAARHLTFLETVHARWQDHPVAGDEVVPNMHPTRNMSHYPEGVVGQAGYHMADTACPIGPNTWAAACLGANVATHAAQLVLDGANVAYGLCRPPGHHAYSDMAGGFCFLNNVCGRRPSHGRHARPRRDPRHRRAPRQRYPGYLLRSRRRPFRLGPRRSQRLLSVLRRLRRRGTARARAKAPTSTCHSRWVRATTSISRRSAAASMRSARTAPRRF